MKHKTPDICYSNHNYNDTSGGDVGALPSTIGLRLIAIMYWSRGFRDRTQYRFEHSHPTTPKGAAPRYEILPDGLQDATV